MSGGSLFLVDRCDVQRYERTAQAYSGKRVAAAHLSNRPCRLMTRKQNGFNSVTGEWVSRTVYQLMVLVDDDIIEGDMITTVTLQDGEILGSTKNDGTLRVWRFQVDGGSLKRRGRMAMHRMLGLKLVT